MLTVEGSVFGTVSLRELLNGFVPNSHGRCVWSLAQTSLKVKVKVKGQGHQEEKRHFLALSATCMRFMFGKTSLVSSFICNLIFDFLFPIKFVFARGRCCHKTSGDDILNLYQCMSLHDFIASILLVGCYKGYPVCKILLDKSPKVFLRTMLTRKMTIKTVVSVC